MEANNNQQGGLQASKHYFLSTEGKRNKSLCFVKLTDSALHSIRMYLESKDSSLPKPSIEFLNNTGVISLSHNGESKKYEFTLSNMEGDGLQSNFQCIQQTDDGYLDSLGAMLMKLQIHAKDDSYEKTKNKMAAADQAQKKFCTKEIKQNGICLGQKLAGKRPGLVSSPEKKNNNSTKSLEPVKPSKNMNYRSSFQTVVNQPVRKRIIHILAVKPYRRPDLMLRLMKEGISEKDKKCVNEVLADIGSLKGNFYSLANHAWNEVLNRWQFCSKEEMETIKRKKEQFLKSDGGNEIQNSARTQLTFNNQSKSLIQNDVLSKSVNGSKKRKTTCNGANNSEKIICNGVNSLHKILKDNSYTTRSKFNFPSVDNHQTFPNPKINGNSTFSSKKNSSVNTQKETPLNHSSMRQALHLFFKANSNRFESRRGMQSFLPNMDLEIPSPTSSTSDSDYSEIKQKYTRIESLEQRNQYVKDFHSDYEEYRKLDKEMRDVSEKFSNLRKRLYASVKGSNESRRIEKEVEAEYKKTLQTKYVDSRERYDFLYSKISYIKNLIIEYDCSQHAKT